MTVPTTVLLTALDSGGSCTGAVPTITL